MKHRNGLESEVGDVHVTQISLNSFEIFKKWISDELPVIHDSGFPYYLNLLFLDHS